LLQITSVNDNTKKQDFQKFQCILILKLPQAVINSYFRFLNLFFASYSKPKS